jgi:hypothetical protein
MKRLIMLAGLGLLAGCANLNGHWVKEDMSGFKMDVYQCKKDTIQSYGPPKLERIDSMIDFARQCMSAKGYTWIPD